MPEETPVPIAGPAPVPEPPEPPAQPAQPAEPEAVEGPGALPAAEPADRPRRRGRTTLLIAAAAVLGVLAGGGLGYRIQDQRDPTPLPPLTGAAPVQPKGAGAVPAALPAAQDRDAVYNGDLLKLLMPTPKGKKQKEHGWIDLAGYAELFEDPAGAFTDFAKNDFRRAVGVEWQNGAYSVTDVRLVQFRDEAAPYTPERQSDEANYADRNPELGESVQIPGTMDGKVWPSARPYRESGYEPEYYAVGLARVGSIYVEVSVSSPSPVRAAAVMSVIKKQLERL